MNYQTYTFGRCRSRRQKQESWLEICCLIGLMLAALLLCLINLDALPLRDWDEATVALVARSIARADSLEGWIFPTVYGEPYLNKPTLIHGLIALSYKAFGESEFSTRLPSAVLTALSVPLLYCLGRELFKVRSPALLAAVIYLTWLPVIRHGRLAMLDGPVLCWSILMLWGILRSRRDLRWTTVAGVGLTLLCLTKGFLIGILIGAIAFGFLLWDTPRLLSSGFWWLGISLSIIPVGAWYGVQFWYYGTLFQQNLLQQSVQRIGEVVEGHQGPIWYYLKELALYGFPWLLFALYGIRLAWRQQVWSWSKLVLVWSGVYFIAVSLMMTKLPWYILPIYPALALAGGAQLAHTVNSPLRDGYPKAWASYLYVLALGAAAAAAWFGFWTPQPDIWLTIICLAAAITLCITAILIERVDRQFIFTLSWGLYVCLLLLVCSPYWNWELNEAYAVKPVAAAISNNVPGQTHVYTSFSYRRPSLDFYSDRPVMTRTATQLQAIWQENSQPYLLVEQTDLNQLQLTGVKIIKKINTNMQSWLLITKQSG